MRAIDRMGERVRRLGRARAGRSGTSGEGSGDGDGPVGAGTGTTAGADTLSDDLQVDPREEASLWERLREDPNDVEAFPRLADMVRRRAAASVREQGGARAGEPFPTGEMPVLPDFGTSEIPTLRAAEDRAADDAVWALAEELAHNGRAWYPLVELGRLSVHDDREASLRRLTTAAERDPSGAALARSLAVLREAGLPSEALGLGVGHWRPREHELEAGRHLVLAAIEARRTGDARRHLEALSLHPDQGAVRTLRAELEGLIARLEAERVAGGPLTDPAGIPASRSLLDLGGTDRRADAGGR